MFFVALPRLFVVGGGSVAWVGLMGGVGRRMPLRNLRRFASM